MPDYALGWVDIAVQRHLALPLDRQRLVDARVQQGCARPAGQTWRPALGGGGDRRIDKVLDGLGGDPLAR